MRTGGSTNGHDAARGVTADPDERRARGPHSIFEDGGRRLRWSLRHTPRRSNLASSLRAVKRRWNPFRCNFLGLKWLNAGARSCRDDELLAARQHGPGHAGILGGNGNDGSPIAAAFGQGRGPSAERIGLALG